MSQRINGFEQIKSFYSWVFNNPDKVRPTHISLYLFLWNQANRANWVEWFKCPYDLAMQGACIGNKGTYYRALDDLKSFKLIDYKKGVNNYKAPQIKLFRLYKSEPLTEQVTVPQSEPLTEPQPVQLPVPIYKPITDNLKLLTNNSNKLIAFIDSLKEQETINEDVIEFSENDIQFRDFLCKEFNISEMTQPRQFMDINQAIMFMNNQPEKINKHFRAQCWNYFTYKEAAEEKKHSSINTFLFDPDHDKYYDRIMGGGWNKSNWYQLGKKISKSKYYEEGEDPEEILNYNK